MNPKTDHICKLCLRLAEIGFKELDYAIMQLFNILFLKLNFDVIRSHIICLDCVKMAKKCLDFKSTCINTEKNILSFSTARGGSKYSIKYIYAEKEHVIDNNEDVCRFCLTRFNRNNFVSLTTFLNEAMFEMLPKFMPEMDFNIMSEKPVICATCRENMEDYFHLVQNCMNIEQKITPCKKESSDKADLISLEDLLDVPVKSHQIQGIKQEHYRLKDTECIYPEAYSLIKHEALDIKDDESDSNKNLLSRSLDKCEGASEMDNISELRIYQCSLCAYVAKHKNGLAAHMSVHKTYSELVIYKCASCAYEAKEKRKLKTHMLVHKDITDILYKCSLCFYETEHKCYLNMHVLVHKDVCDIKMFKCSLCTYEAKRKSNLNTHMVIHKDASEIKMFKCSLCTYEAKRVSNLNTHMLVHKGVSELKTFKCLLCSYEAKRKSHLERHMLTHKDVSEIKMHKCSLCSYEAKRASHLKRHNMLTHKDVTEVTMYKCFLCPYQAKQKSSLKTHLLVHKNVSARKMHKCSSCAYETKQKGRLKTHIMLVHRDAPEIKM